MSWKEKKRRDSELAPDEIFLDASNVSDLDGGRLEGRLEQPLSAQVFTGALLVIGLITFVLIFQAMRLEIIHGAEYAEKSDKNHVRPAILFAKRGAIVDRNGTVIVANHEDEERGLMREYLIPSLSHVTGYVSYPKKDSSGHYYDTETVGLTGIEASLNDTLAGKNGKLLVEEDASGNVRSEGMIVRPDDGKPVTLSIDVRAQDAFEKAIRELADRIGYQGGVGILMDIHTAEIHALVSYPSYDPNVLSRGAPRSVIAGYNTDLRLPYLNRAVSGLYAPGSIVKTIVAAGALTDKIVTPETVIVSTKYLSVPNPYDPKHPTLFPDWKALGPLTVRDAIAHSSDVYFYTVGGGYGAQKGLGIERLDYWYKAFGYGSPTGIELSEATGFIPTPGWKKERLNEDWRIGNTYHTAIGQYAMQITPMEAMRAIAAVANGGQLLTPTILKDTPLKAEAIAVDMNALNIIREGMRQAVTEGTAAGLATLSFTDVAAKTGTAQVGVHNEFINAWITGFFPYENPKYAFVILMDRGPGKTTTGGVYAALQALINLHASAPEYFE